MNSADELISFRKKMFLTAYPLKTAHLASAFSVAEIMYALYCKGIMKFETDNPDWKDRDRLILSKGHASLAQYAALNEAGIISDELLSTFCKPGKSIGGEINPADSPGIETATGSLGHGLGFAVGEAIALKSDNSPARVFCIVGNGEINEGVIWESVMAGRKFELDNLTVILDDNKIQKMGFTRDTMKINNWADKWKAFDWDVNEIEDGNNLNQVYNALKKENKSGKPRIFIANTIKGKGVSIMENNPDWHFKMPYKRELKTFMKELNITQEELDSAKGILN